MTHEQRTFLWECGQRPCVIHGTIHAPKVISDYAFVLRVDVIDDPTAKGTDDA